MTTNDVKLFAASKPLTGVPPWNVLALQQKGLYYFIYENNRFLRILKMVKKFFAAAAVLSLAITPAMAEISTARSVAPVEGESELAGSGLLLALVAAAAALGVVLAVTGDDDPVSP